MSRIRIVGGTITKTTEGAHHMYSEENIVFNSNKTITEVGEENGIVYGEPKDAPIIKIENKDFDITFVLDKNERTIVPFGILDFENNIENPFFSFKYSLSKSKIDSLDFQITDESNAVIYQMKHLQPVIVKASKKPVILFEAKKPKEGPLESKIWNYEEAYKQHALFEPDDYTQIGDYFIHWDGFDNNEIYDSTRFNGKSLKAQITATKDGKQKNITIDFATKYSQVQWTDVKIDKKAKRIDVTLRVNLKDGGAEGLSCWNNTRNFNPPHTKSEICDWDKIPESEINPSHPIIKNRTRSFTDLEKLALEGINYHWGRNKNHFIAKNIKVNNESYELYMNSINVNIKAIGGIELVYNTNGNWARSGNPGSIKDPMSAIGTIVSRQAICYNVGYIYYLDWYEFYKSKKWDYRLDTNEDIDFKFTSAHETGHEILKKYGGTFYSYGHKGSVNSVTQNMKDDAPAYKVNSEIDIMPYYPSSPSLSLFKNYAASEKDVLGLIWLTKIEIK
jgi:hypothetical protein